MHPPPCVLSFLSYFTCHSSNILTIISYSFTFLSFWLFWHAKLIAFCISTVLENSSNSSKIDSKCQIIWATHLLPFSMLNFCSFLLPYLSLRARRNVATEIKLACRGEIEKSLKPRQLWGKENCSRVYPVYIGVWRREAKGEGEMERERETKCTGRTCAKLV